MNKQLNYTEFEASFRGAREEIKARLSVYLPLLKLLSVESSQPALDIACGRGEWLELVTENGIPANGFDINAEFVEQCKIKGLDADKADLFVFFNAPGETRYKLITGFHIVEHLSFVQQQLFLENIFTLLSPGGAVILETPNPENVTVGSCNFYIDPTHLRPVPPHLLRFLAVQAGFASPVIARLNRDTVGEPVIMMTEDLPGATHYNRLADIIASRLLQAPDYALIAFKPPAPDLDMLEAVATINKINDSFVRPPAADELTIEVNDRILLERTIVLERELSHIQELLRQKEAVLKTSNNTMPAEKQSIPFNEYPEAARNVYHKLFAAHVKAKNKTV
jgi:O-antigen chain-terminating methyltransferase